MAFKMKGYSPHSGSPMKIAPALIAKIAPMVMSAASGGGDSGSSEKTEEPTENKKGGLETWMENKQ